MSAPPIDDLQLASTGGELVAESEPGARMVAVAAEMADRFQRCAARHDRDGAFAHEHLDALRNAGFLFGPVPAELGGGGVSSVRDVLIASSRLARGDASTAIGVNMHLAIVMNIVRGLDVVRARGNEARAASVEDELRLVVESGSVFASPVSEPSPQDLTRPSTTATRVDDGWVVEGRKAFATMSPAADLLSVAVTYLLGEEERYGFAIVPTSAPGVVFHDDWDALGMRASASGSVSFDGVHIPTGGLRDGFPVGEHSAAMIDRYLASGALHAAVSLGIAESAHEQATSSLRRRASSVADDPFTIVRLSESVTELAAMRASLDRAGRCLDAYFERHVAGVPELDEVVAPYREVQASKAFLNAAAVRVVDRSLALSGGAGYLASNPLSKAWRDVRAGGFMHPVGANRVDVLLGRTELGLAPA